MKEFELIQRYFKRATPSAVLGIGDDAALIASAPNTQWAISTDMLVGGTHFLVDDPPADIAHKALAVNLSDMAAMGATPRYVTLAAALPDIDESWVSQFAEGLFELAQAHHVELIGGDTTQGPLNFCITVMGELPQGQALKREGAKIGDEIWVSGELGWAALGLAHKQGRMNLPAEQIENARQALYRPQPRVQLGIALRGVANSAIDLSDGLLADLGHILTASGVGAELIYSALPKPAFMQAALVADYAPYVVSGGEDYELCFTAETRHHAIIRRLSEQLMLPLTCIGRITSDKQCHLYAPDGSLMTIEKKGYEHFT